MSFIVVMDGFINGDGSSFIDGKYHDKQTACEARDRHRQMFRSIHIAVLEVDDDFVIPDRLFWANRKQHIAAVNRINAALSDSIDESVFAERAMEFYSRSNVVPLRGENDE
jgi:hypothetical protein|tara:strand:- start:375 stop:707 length:333 start_codon:yes stop_codon:yes gene_type:complete